MSYPDNPTIHESIEQFFTFYENYATREDMDRDIYLGNLEKDDPYFKSLDAFENVINFIEEAYEIAFGDEALNRDFSPEEVIEELQSFSDKALKYDDEDFIYVPKKDVQIIRDMFSEMISFDEVHESELHENIYRLETQLSILIEDTGHAHMCWEESK